MVVVANKGVGVVLCNVHSCCSRDHSVIKDKGVVHSPNPKVCAGDELIGSVVEAVERAKRIG